MGFDSPDDVYGDRDFDFERQSVDESGDSDASLYRRFTKKAKPRSITRGTVSLRTPSRLPVDESMPIPNGTKKFNVRSRGATSVRPAYRKMSGGTRSRKMSGGTRDYRSKSRANASARAFSPRITPKAYKAPSVENTKNTENTPRSVTSVMEENAALKERIDKMLRKMKRFQTEKVMERNRRKDIEKELEFLNKKHNRLQRKYDQLKAKKREMTRKYTDDEYQTEGQVDPDPAAERHVRFNLDGDDMVIVNHRSINSRSSFSLMKDDGDKENVAELLQNIDQLKKNQHQNFVEKIVDDAYDNGEDDEAMVAKAVCKVLFSTLITSYSTVRDMPMSSDMTPQSLKESVFEAMEARFPEEFTSWFESWGHGDQNRDLYLKYIRKSLRICVEMKQQEAELAFFPLTFDGVHGLSKDLDEADYGQIMCRDRLFDITPNGDAWEWQCSFPALVERGHWDNLDDEGIMNMIRSEDTDQFSMFRSNLFVFKSQ